MDITELHQRVDDHITRVPGATERTTDAVMWVVRAALRNRDNRITALAEENQRLRAALDHVDAASRNGWGGLDHQDVFAQWREAVTEARNIAHTP
ncbi:hypothetical protein KGD82_16580 [Nocardiopsis eucommiae]|uniref:Uncharacterized protein n=1 Tax=Nocardiopsis eucommiae TaxID=2831970 RepID=A0A975L8A8_9ACTN|nr:hypothetical protein KGD82_16580 [Nocardiopsis eucommiae]